MLKLIVGFILVLGMGCTDGARENKISSYIVDERDVNVFFVKDQCIAVVDTTHGVAMTKLPREVCGAQPSGSCDAGECAR